MTSMTGDEGQKMMTSTYQHSNGRQEQRTRLDALVLQHLSDRVILKPLTRWNEAYKEFPRYVLEYLCARYIDPNDPPRPEENRPHPPGALRGERCQGTD